ncbi:MAG: electron transfer flavoprotein subunit beta/FixA family protein [Spirochaetes bacterium]|nr:electron transfer flavoprotein subunit beta/FixA family protein [Spirochaetota bacterium]
MNVLACFKMVPDLDMFSQQDWEIDDQMMVETRFVKHIINPYDESALELVLKMRDLAIETDQKLKISALTVGQQNVDRILKNLYALKYQEAVRLDCNADLRFNPPLVAHLVYQFLQIHHSYEVIIMGNQTNEGDNSKTPFLLAEKLGYPCINGVTSFRLAGEPELIEITSLEENYQVTQILKPPVVLVIGNVAKSYLRIPTLKDRMTYSKKEIILYTQADLNVTENIIEELNDCHLVELFQEQKQRKCTIIEGDNPAEKASILYNDFLKVKLI